MWPRYFKPPQTLHGTAQIGHALGLDVAQLTAQLRTVLDARLIAVRQAVRDFVGQGLGRVHCVSGDTATRLASGCA